MANIKIYDFTRGQKKTCLSIYKFYIKNCKNICSSNSKHCTNKMIVYYENPPPPQYRDFFGGGVLKKNVQAAIFPLVSQYFFWLFLSLETLGEIFIKVYDPRLLPATQLKIFETSKMALKSMFWRVFKKKCAGRNFHAYVPKFFSGVLILCKTMGKYWLRLCTPGRFRSEQNVSQST